jgi:uncharacterized protein
VTIILDGKLSTLNVRQPPFLDITIMLRTIGLALLCIGAYFAYWFFMQRNLIYFPDRSPLDANLAKAYGYSAIQLKTEDGLTLQAWYRPAKDQFWTLVYCHGNAGNIMGRVPQVQPYLDQGFGVLLLEYRGYADNPGSPTEAGLFQDGRAALTYLQKEGVPLKRIALMGESLGTGVAVHLTSSYPVGAVILQSAFTSLVDLGVYHYPYLPVRWLLTDRYDSASEITKIRSPILFLHGEYDAIVPIEMGHRLFELAPQPKQFITQRGRGHNDLSSSDMVEEVTEFLKSRITKSLVPSSTHRPGI